MQRSGIRDRLRADPNKAGEDAGAPRLRADSNKAGEDAGAPRKLFIVE